MKKSKETIWIFTICLTLTLLSFYLHVSTFTNTMINYVDQNILVKENIIVTDGFLPWAVDFHQTLPDFKARPITTFLIKAIANGFNIRISVAFVCINFLFTFFNGILIYYLAKLHALSRIQALWSTLIFYSSFSVLLAYFIPIATYDEPIQYFFIFISLIFLKMNKNLLFAGGFALATITRENSLLLLPAIFLFMMNLQIKNSLKSNMKFFYKVFIISVPVLIYFIYLLYFFKTNPQLLQETQALLPEKFAKIHKNLIGWINLSKTILSFISVYLLPIFLITYYQKKLTNETKVITAFWFTFVINTILVILSSYAEESRVLMLPILIVLPIFGKILTESVSISPAFFTYLMCSKRILLLAVVTSLAWLIVDYCYKFTNLTMNENLYREYNTLTVLFIVLVLLYSRFSSAQEPPIQHN